MMLVVGLVILFYRPLSAKNSSSIFLDAGGDSDGDGGGCD